MKARLMKYQNGKDRIEFAVGEDYGIEEQY
jgi:hypothetical protein